jgi:ribulose-5-phosphate 4-epimerase/fuculose-1-phosphate aldolase
MMGRHHGPINIHDTVEKAMMDLYFLEKACRYQVELMNMGQNVKKCEMDLKVAEETHKYIEREADRFSVSLMNAWKNAGV